ncbi:MAG: filamentous hemagglutinin N-terminal domain-containing protein [Oscillatoriophycideae cyanobacterium NC_groundwater_1537_Pr4_S-0.65um_50_18]|nr:filamentous hemagglutinin N-terminal domain-containing protein [Oscillatoriophycideae cyanobacterium NC_groundwater_1537_Pr4_S-0.65um_50_18]
MNRSHLTAWALMGSILSASLCTQPIVAQVIPDATLPAGERSQVIGNPNMQIDGGARRGGNLFHSFSQFSVPTGGSTYFNNAADVQNIFSRVTGGSISNIDGLIRANGTANLFLLNPNGILFGPNASLNIGGSFMGTTANAIGFPNGEVFSSDATQPLPSQLLTVNPNALFFNQLTPQPIVNQSTFSGTGLQVPARQNLMLVGGAVRLDNGRLTSPGSYVELGGVGGVGTVSLSTSGEDWRLDIPDSVPRADVFLRNGGQIDFRNFLRVREINGIIVIGDSGSIRILGRNIDLSGSSLWLEIPTNSESPDAKTRGIELDATGSIAINESVIANRLFSQGTTGSIILTAGDRISFANKSLVYNTIDYGGGGRTGDINVTTGSLSLADSSQLISGTRGPANTGSVNINARDTVLIDGSRDGYSSSIYNIVDGTGIGNAGGINIMTRSLSLTRGGALASYTNGQGNAGNVIVNAHDTILIDGGAANEDGNYTNSGITTQVSPALISNGIDMSQGGAVGQGGNVTLSTGSLFLTNGGNLDTSNTDGTGNSGRVTIYARDSVQIRGTNSNSLSSVPSRVVTSVSSGNLGSSGDVIITTGSLSVAEQGQISTTAQGQGRAGDIRIRVRDAVSFDAGEAISTLDREGTGRGGDINITARSLSVLNDARLSASTAGAGNAGNITVSADTVGLSRGGQLLTTTSSRGQAGNITLNTPELQMRGTNSGLFAGTNSTGDAGNLTIQPRNNQQDLWVNLQDGAQISASTSSTGQGGDLTITAPDSITLTGSGSVIAAGTGSSGAGGNLNLRTDTLNVQDQAEVTVSSSGTGSAGSLFVDADRIFLNHQGSIRADTTGGGGNINLRSPFLLLRNGSNITTNATGSNIAGGDIAIDTRFLIAVANEDSNISANSEDFRGGNVSINAFAIYGIQPRPNATPLSDITATGATSALSGTIDVTTAGLDPTSGLVALPNILVDSSGLIAQGCFANQGNSFVISGRGGLPPTPEQQLDDDADWQDRRRLSVAQQVRHRREIRSQESGVRMDSQLTTFSDTPNPRPYTPMTEATDWQIAPTGEIFLVANISDPTVQNRLSQAAACQGE